MNLGFCSNLLGVGSKMTDVQEHLSGRSAQEG